MRHPAGVQGLYGLRPTKGSIESRGFVLSKLMDTVGFFTRSAHVARTVWSAIRRPGLEEPASNVGERTYRLIYCILPESCKGSETPQFFPRPGQVDPHPSPAKEHLEAAIKNLESLLGVKRTPLDLYALWRETHPEGEPANLGDATNTIYQNIIYYNLYNDTIKPYVSLFRKQNKGRAPLIEPLMNLRLNYGKNTTTTAYQTAIDKFHKYATWIREVVFNYAEKSSNPYEIPILVYPQTWGCPDYRDSGRPVDPKNLFWSGFSVYSMAYVGGGPDITIPVGEVPFQSKVTEREERLPVSLSVLSRPGYDTVLLDLLVQLEKMGGLRDVATGERLYEHEYRF
jgi:Asp-tRNA(Asn)/Glu-tRNA(Gln) amidotransferase A subunit family amidase